jgi:hypothetical protein
MTVPLKLLHLEDDRQDATLVEATLAADGLEVAIRRVRRSRPRSGPSSST